MKIDYIAVPTIKYPCFGFVVLKQNDKLYVPNYDDGFVSSFTEIKFEDLYLLPFSPEYEIAIGSKRIYSLYMNEEDIYIGNKDEIVSMLTPLVFAMDFAPFSQLEIAEFCNLSNETIVRVKNNCYEYLKKIDEKQAEYWLKSNCSEKEISFIEKANIPIKPSTMTEKTSPNTTVLGNTQPKKPYHRVALSPTAKTNDNDIVTVIKDDGKTIRISINKRNHRMAAQVVQPLTEQVIANILLSTIQKTRGSLHNLQNTKAVRHNTNTAVQNYVAKNIKKSILTSTLTNEHKNMVLTVILDDNMNIVVEVANAAMSKSVIKRHPSTVHRGVITRHSSKGVKVHGMRKMARSSILSANDETSSLIKRLAQAIISKCLKQQEQN